MSNTSNSDKSSKYSKKLSIWLTKNKLFIINYTIIIITIYNLLNHKQKNFKETFRKYNILICLFSLIFTHRNAFFIIKNKLKKIQNKEIVKLQTKLRIVEICKSLKQVKSKSFKHLFKNMYLCINEYI